MGWFTRTHPLELPSGRILVPMYSDGYSYGIMAISDDRGTTWTAVSRSSAKAAFSLGSPQAGRHTGRVYARQRSAAEARATSATRRMTASPGRRPEDTDIPNPGTSLEDIRLRNGNWIMVTTIWRRGATHSWRALRR